MKKQEKEGNGSPPSTLVCSLTTHTVGLNLLNLMCDAGWIAMCLHSDAVAWCNSVESFSIRVEMKRTRPLWHWLSCHYHGRRSMLTVLSSRFPSLLVRGLFFRCFGYTWLPFSGVCAQQVLLLRVGVNDPVLFSIWDYFACSWSHDLESMLIPRC